MDIIYGIFVKYFQNLGISEALVNLLFILIPFILIIAFILFSVLFLVWLERKFLACATRRIGPNICGPYGLFQTLADAFKLFLKQDTRPVGVDLLLFFLAPVLSFVPVVCAFAFLHYSPYFDLIKSHVGVLFFCGLISIPIIATLISACAQNNKYAYIGGLRGVAAAISYELPLMLSVLSASILGGSLSFSGIMNAQNTHFGLLGWFFIPSIIGFIIFLISLNALLNRTPFDYTEAESELGAGYTSEYSGMKFALFYLSEYALLLVMSLFTVTIFFGGYLSPLGFYIFSPFGPDSVFVHIEQVFWLFLKTYILILFFMLTRATLTRVKIETMMNFAWKVLLPLSFLNLFIVCLIKYVRGVL